MCVCIHVHEYYIHVRNRRRVFVLYHTDRCSEGQMRLVGGQTKREGRLEVCLNSDGNFGTLCDKQWSLALMRIPCRYMGYAEEGEYPYTMYMYTMYRVYG